MANVEMNTEDPEVEVRKGPKNAVRNVLVAFGLFWAIPALAVMLENMTTSASGWSFNYYMNAVTSPFGLSVGALLVALFARSFYEVFVTRGVAVAAVALAGGSLYMAWIYLSVPALYLFLPTIFVWLPILISYDAVWVAYVALGFFATGGMLGYVFHDLHDD